MQQGQREQTEPHRREGRAADVAAAPTPPATRNGTHGQTANGHGLHGPISRTAYAAHAGAGTALAVSAADETALAAPAAPPVPAVERLQPQAKFAGYALTFDDVLLLPARSDVAPTDPDTSTHLTRRIR